jgi:uncharacterized protein YdhG (YjbR/CyaY superfamily)
VGPYSEVAIIHVVNSALAVSTSAERGLDQYLADALEERTMKSTIVGGAMLPHAPQFFTLPDTEDPQVVQAVRKVAADIGERLRALNPDLWIIFSNDHAEQFFHHTARLSPFTSAAKHPAISPVVNFIGRFQARSASKSFGNSTDRISTLLSAALRKSTMRSEFH